MSGCLGRRFGSDESYANTSSLVAIRPGLVTPVLAARMGAALDQLSGGRAMINVVTGSSVRDLEELGDPLAHAHDERYVRASEYMEVMKRSWTQSTGLNLTEFAGSVSKSNAEASSDGNLSLMVSITALKAR